MPIQVTTLYKLCKDFLNGKILIATSWSELAKRGRKPYLTSKELMTLIKTLQKECDGGNAISLSDIKDRLNKEIREKFRRNRELDLLKDIPEATLNSYASIIKSQNIFTIYSSVSNKTESRSTAEWSIRSTISYALAVACAHFIPDIEPTTFHPKKSDLSEEAVELWNLCEYAYNKMIGNNGTSKINLYPVLPNLITSSDEVTVFATSSIINGQDKLYIVS